MLVDTGANVTLLRTDLAQKLKEQLIYTAPNISLKTATGEKTEIRGKLDASIECGSRKFHHRIYVADVTDPCILGLGFLQKFNFTVDLEKNEIRTGGEDIPLFLASVQHSKSCSVLAKKRTIIPARSECLIQGVPKVPEQFRYAITDFPSQVSQKGVLVATALVDLKREAIPVRVLNLNNKPTVLDKGAVIATYEPVADIVARPQKFSGEQHLPSTLDNLEILDEEQRTAVRKLLKKFQNLFSTCNTDVGHCNMTQHRITQIHIGDHPPIKQYPRRLPLARKEEADNLVKEIVNNGIIEESSGPWASPIVLVKKKDGSTRFCVDYRKLNEIAKKDSYPLPRIDDTLDALNGSQWFTTLVLKSGYWQVEIRSEDREKTAFTTGQGLWQFKVMPFGLCNGPAAFERLMETVLRRLSSEACLVYLDEIIIVGRTFKEHLNNLSERIKTDPEKIKAVVDWPRPETIHDLRSFLGLCTYYRRFVKNFSTIARPLHKLTEAKSNFNWTEDCEKSFNSLKQALTSPILTYPWTDKDFILDMDASNEGIGAVLFQNIGNEEHVIAYFSKSLETDTSVKVLTTTSVDPWSSCEIQKAQLEDPAIKPILEKKLNSADRLSWQEIAPESPATKRYWALWDSLHLKDSVLYRRWRVMMEVPVDSN
ncbi:Retrovirus-related Pol polyprotein from transposon 412 [Araneus ventricosus]|uniref:RNA-directed DNA polymerase n=1 Tax=Araneus ventricosus TaxID=182803 RepID=A0A4Y2EY91_ARAVE|nr:Retrovirus-related Pol polyprotein from transposon 412 [Araneus ventricosus]